MNPIVNYALAAVLVLTAFAFACFTVYLYRE